MKPGFVIDKFAWPKVLEQLLTPSFKRKPVFSKFVADRIEGSDQAQIEDLTSALEECRALDFALFEYLKAKVDKSVLSPIQHHPGSFDSLQKDDRLAVLEPMVPERTAERIANDFNAKSSEYALSSRPMDDYIKHVAPHAIDLKYRQSIDLKTLFRSYRQYSKTLIIADPYLFNQKSAVHVRDFIDALVKKPEYTRIILLTSDFRDEKRPETDFTPLKGLNGEIRFVNQSIVKDEMHDRWVIADWTAFSIGAGLDAFISGKVTKTTTIQVHPRLSSFESYETQRLHHEWLIDDKQSKRFMLF